MYAQTAAMIGQAVQHFQRGDLEQAQSTLERVLRAHPRDFDALHILGVIYATRGQLMEAIELFRKALGINKNHSLLQFNMAKALSEGERDEEALIHHKRATQLAPAHAEAWLNYGRSLLRLGRRDEAAGAFERAISANPSYAAAWSNLGLVLTGLGRRAEALVALDKAIALQPDLAEALNSKGLLLDRTEEQQDSLACYERAVQLQPGYVDAWQNMGARLGQMGRHAEAIACFKRALELNPQLAEAWNNMASSYLELDKIDDAIACYENAIERRPDYASANADLGVLLLQTGQFARGWEKFEFRLQLEDRDHRAPWKHRPRWDGTASGRPLLLWGEQGIGDQILYGSVLPELADLPGTKYVALDQRLIPLFARSMTGFEFIDLAPAPDLLDFSEQLPLGSLPSLYRPDLTSFSQARHPYLTADAQRANTLRQKIMKENRLICGVSWSSSREIIGARKSISLEQLLTPLSSERLHFVNLQYGDTRRERDALWSKHGIETQSVDEVDNLNDIDGLAALIQACDLVITTSNSTAHLAGALGKNVLLLLPSGKSRIWYWTEFGGQNLWYPSIRTFTQCVPGDWTDPLARLRHYLESRSWT